MVALSNGLQWDTMATATGRKALHRHDIGTVRMRHQSRAFPDPEAKTGLHEPVILASSSRACMETEVEDMRSSNVGQVLPASAFSYSVSLRARHPTLDLSVLTEKLRLEPAHSWKAGEPRRSQSGAPLGGQHRDSYWSAPLPAQMTGPNSMPLELFFNQQVLQLVRHRDFIAELQADGGELSLLVELVPVANASLTFTPATARRLADLNIEVEFQFVGD
jgi:hypothetical protein